MANNERSNNSAAPASVADRRKRTRSSAARPPVIATPMEALENRVLFTVTLNNGLATSDPGYFQVTLGAGDSVAPGGAILGSTSILNKYSAIMDLGVVPNFGDEVVDFGNLTAAQGVATTAVAGGVDTNSAVSTITINTYVDYVLPNGVIQPAPVTLTIDATATLPLYGDTLEMQYSITSNPSTISNAGAYDLSNARLYQYMDSQVDGATDSLVLVSGAISSSNLNVDTIDPATFINAEQANGADNVGATLTGFGADQYNLLQQTILAGGYNPPATGDFGTLQQVTEANIGSGYGTGHLSTALAYQISNSQQAFISADFIAFQQPPTSPDIEVLGNDIYIPSGSTTPEADNGTDFGAALYPTSQYFEIKDVGSETLSLPGAPEIYIGGAGGQFFSVTVNPIRYIASDKYSLFEITFAPQSAGLEQATVYISNNTTIANPYSFEIQGGRSIQPRPDPQRSRQSSHRRLAPESKPLHAQRRRVGLHQPHPDVQHRHIDQRPRRRHPHVAVRPQQLHQPRRVQQQHQLHQPLFRN